MLIRYLYGLLGQSASVFFNILNMFLFGNLPPFGSVVVIVEDQGRFLVLRRHGEYVFPGGFMRWREHPTQTGRREVYEETGLDVKIGALIGYHSADSTSFVRMSTLILVFRGEVIGGELRGGIEGRPFWVDEAELQANLVPYYAHLLEKYRAVREKTCSPEVS
ncbi:MAG TPA: NUDIX hydrolase [Ktedonobacteraceae bacterium]|nr:NUDIX hydrolase [Ktedonobacteraceae bacterium]